MRNLLLAFSVITIMATTTACNNSVSVAEKKDAAVITDAKLYPFLLGGIYFFHGYGGNDQFTEKIIKGQMQSKPGDDGFLDELHTMYTEYFYFPFKDDIKADAQNTLKEYWNISDKASYDKEMESLITNGHQASYAALSTGAKPKDAEDKEHLAFITAHKSEFTKGGIKAWDIARYANNIAVGFAAGYVTKEEANTMMEKLPALAHGAYGSWAEYWTAFNLGRKYWAGDVDNDAAFDKDVADMQQGDYSIYKYMKW